MKNRKTLPLVVRYTLLFLPCYLLSRGMLVALGRLPLWEVDGMMQHYPFFVYIGQWLREGLRTGHFTRFSFSLGFGQDTLTALNYYGLGDPVTLLSALFSGAGCEIGFALTQAFRVWLAGLAAALLARVLDPNEKKAVVAGLLYILLPTVLTRCELSQSIFLNPYIHFPLILLGLEYSFRGEKTWVLALSVAWCGLCGFYFLFAELVLALLYALVRWFTRGAEKPWHTLPGAFLRAAGMIALGCGIACAVLLPVTMCFLSSQRTAGLGNAGGLRLWYTLSELKQFPRAVLTGAASGAVPFVPVLGLYAGFTVLKRGSKSLRAVLIGTAILVLSPATGYVLNGMSYETQRWAYAPTLLIALMTARILPEMLEKRTRSEMAFAAGITCVVLAYIAFIWKKGLHAELLFTAVMAVLSLAVLCVTEPRLRTRLACGVLALQLIGVCGLRTYAARDTLIAAGEAMARIADSAYSAAEPDTRADVSQAALGSMINAGALFDTAGTTVYNSLLPSGLTRLLTELCPMSVQNGNAVLGLEACTILETLFGVDTYITNTEDTRVPYGFTPAESANEAYSVWKNEYALPIAYTQTMVMSEAEFDALNRVEKQWALLTRAVTGETKAVTAAEYTPAVTEIPIDSVEYTDAERTGKGLRVTPESRITLTFRAPAGCELYLEVDDCYERYAGYDITHRVRATCGDVETSLLLFGETASVHNREMSVGLINLGCSDAERGTAELSFTFSDTVGFTGFRLYLLPMATYESRAGILQDGALTDIEIGDGYVRGTVLADGAETVVTSIPYTDGWRVLVDGREEKLITNAGAFLAVEVTGGTHTVEFVYETPYAKTGVAISLASILLLLGHVFGVRQRKMKKERSNAPSRQ